MAYDTDNGRRASAEPVDHGVHSDVDAGQEHRRTVRITALLCLPLVLWCLLLAWEVSSLTPMQPGDAYQLEINDELRLRNRPEGSRFLEQSFPPRLERRWRLRTEEPGPNVAAFAVVPDAVVGRSDAGWFIMPAHREHIEDNNFLRYPDETAWREAMQQRGYPEVFLESPNAAVAKLPRSVVQSWRYRILGGPLGLPDIEATNLLVALPLAAAGLLGFTLRNSLRYGLPLILIALPAGFLFQLAGDSPCAGALGVPLLMICLWIAARCARLRRKA